MSRGADSESQRSSWPWGAGSGGPGSPKAGASRRLPRTPSAPREAPVAEGTTAVVETELGSFTILLLPAVAPRPRPARFVKTAKAGGYDGTTFHRLIAGGIIQGGDPSRRTPRSPRRYGQGGLGLLKAEFSDRPSCGAWWRPPAGRRARTAGEPVLRRASREQPSLLGQFTIFGEVTEGMEVVDKISRGAGRRRQGDEADRDEGDDPGALSCSLPDMGQAGGPYRQRVGALVPPRKRSS